MLFVTAIKNFIAYWEFSGPRTCTNAPAYVDLGAPFCVLSLPHCQWRQRLLTAFLFVIITCQSLNFNYVYSLLLSFSLLSGFATYQHVYKIIHCMLQA